MKMIRIRKNIFLLHKIVFISTLDSYNKFFGAAFKTTFEHNIDILRSMCQTWEQTAAFLHTQELL